MKLVKFRHFMDDQLASTEYKKQQANFLIMHCIGKGRQLPLRALGRCPQITDHNKQNKCKNIPEGSYDPGTLPPLAEGICCFEIDLENEVMVINQVIQTIRFQNWKSWQKFRMNQASLNCYWSTRKLCHLHAQKLQSIRSMQKNILIWDRCSWIGIISAKSISIWMALTRSFEKKCMPFINPFHAFCGDSDKCILILSESSPT